MAIAACERADASTARAGRARRAAAARSGNARSGDADACSDSGTDADTSAVPVRVLHTPDQCTSVASSSAGHLTGESHDGAQCGWASARPGPDALANGRVTIPDHPGAPDRSADGIRPCRSRRCLAG